MAQAQIKLTIRHAWWLKPAAVVGIMVTRLFPSLRNAVASVIVRGIKVEVA